MRYIYKTLALAITHGNLATLHDPNSPGWKVGADGKLETDANGNPQWVGADGRVASVAGDTIARLNREAQTLREAKTKAEDALKPFEGMDAAKAKAAIELTANLDAGKLIEAGKVDELKAQIAKGYEDKLKAESDKYGALERQMQQTTLDNHFSRSKFVSEKIATPLDMFQSAFSKHFPFENGKIVPKDANGNPIYSRTKIGEIADFDDAIEQLVDAYPAKDRILTGRNQQGSGSTGASGAKGTGKVVRRSDFNAMNPVEQANVAAEARAGTAQIVD